MCKSNDVPLRKRPYGQEPCGSRHLSKADGPARDAAVKAREPEGQWGHAMTTLLSPALIRDPAFWVEIAASPSSSNTAFSADTSFEWVASPRVMPFACRSGGHAFMQLDPFFRVWDMHSLFTIEGWASDAFELAVYALDVLPSWQVVTTYSADQGTEGLLSLLGFAPAGEYAPVPDGGFWQSWVLTREAYARSNAGLLAESDTVAGHGTKLEKFLNLEAVNRTNSPTAGSEAPAAGEPMTMPNTPTLRRTLSADYLNTVANHPDVRPYIGGEGDLDLSELLASPANFALQFEGGGFIALALGAGIYDVHTLTLAGARGAVASEVAEQAQNWMFAHTDCVELVTRVPASNKAAAAFATAHGFREKFQRSAAWPSVPPEDVTYYGLTIDVWAQRSVAAGQAGHDFHDAVEAAKIEQGSQRDVHDDDRAHNHAAGAAYLMVAAGNCQKGVEFYNRWASQAGYARIGLLGLNPVLIDIHDAIIGPIDGKMEVIQCR